MEPRTLKSTEGWRPGGRASRLKEGETVMVVVGPLRGRQGRVGRLDRRNSMAEVLMALWGRRFCVCFQLGQLGRA
jgi:transcription antitermination factor NusG